MGTEGDDSKEPSAVDPQGETERPPSPADVPPARARTHATPELAHRIAEFLAMPHATLMGASANAGVHYRSVKRWLAAEDTDDNPELSEFQLILTQAIERERVREVETLETEFAALGGPIVAKASALVNKWQWNHANRFKRVYAEDDVAKKTALELTGKDGGPVESATTVRYVVMVPQDEAEE